MDFLDHIRFPSKKEWNHIIINFPTSTKLFFSTDLYLEGTSIHAFEEFIKHQDLSNWKTRFNNKLGKLRFSYVLAIYYSKNVIDVNWIKHDDNGNTNFFPNFANKKDLHNKFIFDYFSESFYYHYFSCLDILGHLLCVFFKIQIPERRIDIFKVVNKITDIDLKKYLNEFLEKIQNAKEKRNGLTHRFPFNEIDMRSKSIDNVLNFGLFEYISSTETIDEIHEIIIELEKILRIIESKMKTVH